MARRKKKGNSSIRKGKLTKSDFVKIPNGKNFKSQANLKYGYVIERRSGKRGAYKFRSIKRKNFKRGSYYRIFVKHKPTGQKRLLGFGKFYSFPDESKLHHKAMGGRTFLPKGRPLQGRGKWIPTWKIVKSLEEEVAEAGKEQKTEVRGSIIPVRTYYHTEWKVYSDTMRSGNENLKGVAVSVLMHYVYPNNSWIQKRTVVLDLRPRGIKIKNLVKYEEKIIDFVVTEMRFEHPNLNFEKTDVLAVNGFVPLDYLQPKKG